MTTGPLLVELEGQMIATIRTDDSAIALEYEQHYRESLDATPLSFSMPRVLRGHAGAVPGAWLQGLLPDNEDVLRRWARDFDASISSPSSFLATDIGLDCAGAVRFYPQEQIADRRSGVDWLDGSELEARIRELHTDARSWLGPRGEGQFSLAGAQTKTALRWDELRERWGSPYGDEPSTHIIKPAVPGFVDQHINEHLCLAAAASLGLTAAPAKVAMFGEEQALVVARFDRHLDSSGAWTRVHQEDMCQAQGVHPSRKYESDGGPTAASIVTTIREATGSLVAPREVSRFVDSLIFNWIVGGTDGHAKNYGLLHSGRQTRLAPLYDVSSFLPYDDSKGHKLTLAMKIGGEYRVKRIGRKAWGRFAEDCGLDASAVIARCAELATATPAAFEAAADHYVGSNVRSTLPEQLAVMVSKAASERLDSLAE